MKLHIPPLLIVFPWFFALSSSFATSSHPAVAQAGGVTAQMGLKVSPDTVAIGDRFTLEVIVRVKPGFTAEFPQGPDSSEGKPSMVALTAPAKITRSTTDSLQYTATYTLSAWNIGVQPIPITDVHLTGPQGAGFLPIRTSVFVKSVLPADTSKQIPKPPRDRFPVHHFNWWPWIIAAIALALLGLGWWIWKKLRERARAPRDPYEVATEEFARIEALQLPAKGESERHLILMSDTMRAYLSAKVESVRYSDTSTQLVRHLRGAQLGDDRVGEVLDEADLVKFAHAGLAESAAMRLGADARAIVDLVEQQLTPVDEKEAKAA